MIDVTARQNAIMNGDVDLIDGVIKDRKLVSPLAKFGYLRSNWNCITHSLCV